MSKLYDILYGPDGASGLIGDLRFLNEVDPYKVEEARKRVRELVDALKQRSDTPNEDIAALCSMFIDLSANAELNPKANEVLEEMDEIVQELAVQEY